LDQSAFERQPVDHILPHSFLQVWTVPLSSKTKQKGKHLQIIMLENSCPLFRTKPKRRSYILYVFRNTTYLYWKVGTQSFRRIYFYNDAFHPNR
jgi:hypothetical protein